MNVTRLYIWLLSVIGGLLFAACQYVAVEEQVPDCAVTINLFVETPGTKVIAPTPGTGHEENEHFWTRLDLFFVYSDGTVVTETLSKTEYDQASQKQFVFVVPEGNFTLYSIAYHDQLQQPYQPTTLTEVKALRTASLSSMNAPNVTDENKKQYLLSLFSGYTQTITAKSGVPVLLNLHLDRLVAKVDIQWDAKAAYEGLQYTDVQMSAMRIDGLDQGYFFPDLMTAELGTAPLQSVATYKMDNPISKRNGRTYFYVFAGARNQISFNVTYQKTADQATTPPAPYVLTYEAKFVGALTKASWHKVNFVVRGTKKPEAQSGDKIQINLSPTWQGGLP